MSAVATPAKGGQWTVRDLLDWTVPFFERKGIASSRLDAELLLAHSLGCERLQLYLDRDRPLIAHELDHYRALVGRRAKREPLAYIVGYREFYGRKFKVDSRVLIPRPETEHLVDRVLTLLPEQEEATLLDLCSGSGCIGITLVLERPTLVGIGVELSPDAAQVARENAEFLGAGRYQQRLADLYTGVHPGETFSVIVSNPPYVSETELATLAPELSHEPKQALVAANQGLALARQVVAGALGTLASGGVLLMEHGDEQGAALREAAAAGGLVDIETLRDLAGHERILMARSPQAATTLSHKGVSI